MAKLNLVVLAVFLVGCAFAQTVVDLVPGVTPTVGVITPVLTSDAAEYPQNFYRLWVPENVDSLTLLFTQTDADAICSGDIRYNIHADHIPCGTKWSEGTGATYPCREAITDYFTNTSPDTETLFPGSTTNSVLLTPGSWVYISLSRDVTSDFAEPCSYTILTTLTTCATAGTYAVNEGSSTATCQPHNDVTLPYVSDTYGNGVATTLYHRIWVQPRTAHIMFYLNNTESSTYFYGNPKYAGGDYYYECYDYASYVSVNDNYQLLSACFNPPAGWFYLYVESSSAIIGNVSITAKVCPEDQAGFNCTYQAWNLTGSAALAGAQYGVEPYEGGSSIGGFGDGFKIWYISSANGTSGAVANYNFTVTLTVGTSSYLYYRHGGWIADSSDNYLLYEGLALNTPETIALTWADFWVGGEYVFGVSNEGSALINFTLSSAAAAGTSGATGAPTTGDATTGDSGSGASSVVVSFALVAALIAALF